MLSAVGRASEERVAAIKTIKEVKFLSWKNQMKELVTEGINLQGNILGIT